MTHNDLSMGAVEQLPEVPRYNMRPRWRNGIQMSQQQENQENETSRKQDKLNQPYTRKDSQKERRKDTGNSTGKSGVAIVMNKDLVKTDEAKMMELIPGRAILLQAPWHGGDTFMWLAIYAPNMDTESKAIQRGLKDGWQLANPDKKDYSYTQMSGKYSWSRIDQIYVSDTKVDDCEQWEIKNPPIMTDNHVISVQMTSPRAPYLGKGR
ncbi:hypothetical protein EDD18DRAFT_1109982 [Armillaria luteobubalina]|uniref:Uncharacterized protein n=1 Tax=Armillaria luteobubalina TaxID=153913 RepID=A0AA39PTF5_9AGAR|nr:hypothetical protein EDD18DRAFT_1109982 [Armillaria luteobubalina]